MDGTTESIIAVTESIVGVIGHPIAGNPSQLAIERALGHLNLDWRVLSFDVEANSITQALDGCDVLGFRGVLIDRSLQLAASRWHQRKQSDLAEDLLSQPASADVDEASALESENPPLIDCLYRRADGSVVGRNLLHDWSSDFASTDSFSTAVWVGNHLDEPSIYGGLKAYSELSLSCVSWPPDPEELAPADLIVLGSRSQDSGDPVDVSEWPETENPKVVLDLTDADDLVLALKQKRYQLLSRFDVQVALLRRSIQCWTEMDTDTDARDLLSETIADAIEEYLGV